MTLEALEIAVDTAYTGSVLTTVETYDLKSLLGFSRSLELKQYPYRHFGLRTEAQAPAYIRQYFERALHFGTITSQNPLSQKSALLVGNSFTPVTAANLAPGYRTLTYIEVNALQEREYARFFTELVPRIAADDLIFVFNDNVVATVVQPWANALRGAAATGDSAPEAIAPRRTAP